MIVQRALVGQSRSEASPALVWLVAIAGFAFDCAAYWPGQMSFDSAYAWWQARGGDTTDIAPPILIFLWRACDAVLEGPGLVFALHLALFWSGLALLANALGLGRARAIAFLLIAAFAPVPWLLRGHVWTDVGLFSALLFVTGAFAKAQATRRRVWIVAALPALLYAAAIRHNALPALIPFAVWTAWLAGGGATTRARVALGGALLFGAAVLFAIAIDMRVDRRVPLWPAVAQWDLAALSVASGEMLLPPFMIGPGLDVPELAGAFRDWSMVPMLQNTRHGIRDPFDVYTQEELSALRAAWFDAIRAHLHAWLAHQSRRVGALLGVHDPAWPRELVYVDDEVGYRDNPPVARNASALHRMLMRAAASLVSTPILAGWPYLVVGLLAARSAWRRRRENAGRIALVLLISAWLYVVPLLMLAPAELRYLGWCCLASIVAAELAWLVPASFPMRPDRLLATPRRNFR